MAFAKGRLGYVKIGADTMIQTRNWELNLTPDEEDVTSHGDTFHKRETPIMDWNATVELSGIDFSDTAQAALKTALETNLGASVTLVLYESATHYWSGSAIPRLTQRTAATGIVAGTLAFAGNGAIAYT